MATQGQPVATAPLSLRHEFVRKALHLIAAVFPLAYALGAPRGAIELALATVSVAALLIEVLRRTSGSAKETYDHVFGALTRPHEAGSLTGATWLALSCLVAVAVLSRGAAIAALWCATVGDPVATIVGKWTTRHAANPAAAGKTIAGSLGCAIASFAGVWLVAGYAPAAALMVAVGASIAEMMPVRLDDNIRVAAVAGAIAQIVA